MINSLIIAVMIGLMAFAVYAAVNILRITLPHIRAVRDTALPGNQTMMQKIENSGHRENFRKHTTQFGIAFAGLIAAFPFLLVNQVIS